MLQINLVRRDLARFSTSLYVVWTQVPSCFLYPGRWGWSEFEACSNEITIMEGPGRQRKFPPSLEARAHLGFIPPTVAAVHEILVSWYTVSTSGLSPAEPSQPQSKWFNDRLLHMPFASYEQPWRLSLAPRIRLIKILHILFPPVFAEANWNGDRRLADSRIQGYIGIAFLIVPQRLLKDSWRPGTPPPGFSSASDNRTDDPGGSGPSVVNSIVKDLVLIITGF
ncbi:hypothetical protein BS47DRAFT_1392641 [Hydnum rufescens UP504]|uniref:Uncharacterized protein n=1 Tax=Hydnum rufescens UP504 TaxID=1448309 RepID=A0A9P6DX34_9AGAM|nr:hypothetical protein BS47DRAFT_1392641 [Hydnum rufescens UP504]